MRPLRFRRVHRAMARVGGYFWLPCPSCLRSFGGHEWRGGAISRCGAWLLICPACYADGIGGAS